MCWRELDCVIGFGCLNGWYAGLKYLFRDVGPGIQESKLFCPAKNPSECLNILVSFLTLVSTDHPQLHHSQLA